MISTKELDATKRMIAKCIEASKDIEFDTPDGRAVYSNLLVEFGIMSKILESVKMYAENGFLKIEVFNEISEEFVKLGALIHAKVTLFIVGVKA